MNSKILLNQIESDLQMLRGDIDENLYEQNTEGFLKEVDRITGKLNDAKEQKCLEGEMDQAVADERMAEEVEPEEEEPGRHIAF